MIKFLHVVKTGGSSVGKHVQEHVANYCDVRISRGIPVSSVLAQGHLGQIGWADDGHQYMTIVRDPAAWYPSVYNQDVSRIGADIDFWDWYDRGGENTVIPFGGTRDRQFIYLAKMVNAGNLSEVLWRLEHFYFVTTTEYLDHDAEWLFTELAIPTKMERRYRVAGRFDGIDGIEVHRRFTPDVAGVERLREENRLDTMMWLYVRGLRLRRDYGCQD